MSPIEKFFVWMGGYSPKTVQYDHTEDRESITKIGAAVLFAALVAVLNWGIAGWTYAESAPTAWRLAIAALAALFGAGIVLVFDRGFVYYTDTAGNAGRFKSAMYAAFRVAVIVAVGAITTQAVMPLVLGSELKAHALSMVEANEKQRAASLGEQFGLAGKEAASTAAAGEVQKLEVAVASIPVDIQRRLTSARNCWVDYATQKSALITAGATGDEARERLVSKATVCARDSKSSAAERDAYLTRTRTQLGRAIDARQAQQSELSESKSTVKARLVRARDVEEDSFTPRSSAVLWDLLQKNPGARTKWLIISFLLLVCELLPLIQKFQAGQSNIGKRIGANRQLRSLASTTSIKQAEHDYAVSCAVNSASLAAVEDATRSARLKATFAEAFANNIAAVAPTEAVLAMMRDLEARHVDVEDYMRRFPRYAGIISQAWSKAVQQTAEILARGAPA